MASSILQLHSILTCAFSFQFLHHRLTVFKRRPSKARSVTQLFAHMSCQDVGRNGRVGARGGQRPVAKLVQAASRVAWLRGEPLPGVGHHTRRHAALRVASDDFSLAYDTQVAWFLS